MREAEEECHKLKNQIQKVELLLRENRNLFSTTYGTVEDEIARISPRGRLEGSYRNP